MARRCMKSEVTGAMTAAPSSRLDLIKKRHQELILKPREALAADVSSEDHDDPFDELLGADQMEMADVVTTGRL